MPFILAAFGITWVVLLGYAWHLHRVRSDAERRLREANDALTGGARSGGVRAGGRT
jgi:CcmD family protein